ncbi:MAG: ABC transporter permease [Synergistaceae bacterium]|jgi:peptide/nickel transport system permease protein|nr:ABC transporter permease [Synergistaceae bacterium]
MASQTQKTAAAPRKKSRLRETCARMAKNKIAMAGFFIFAAIMTCVVLADFIVPLQYALKQDMAERYLSPSWAHPFGTDLYGRDIFARIIHGSRNSLLLGISAVVVGVSIGGFLGSVAGYFGGVADAVISRVLDTIMCIPFMLLALAIVASLGTGIVNVLIALMVAMVPYYTRVIRAAILNIVEMDFIEAARACGASHAFIIIRHVLPNAIGTVIVQATMSVGSMIISAAAMSFLGMGIQPPAPEWGSMLSEGKDYMMTYPHMVIFPGLAITLTALSVNLMGDGLRDALDPRLKD